MFASLSNDQKKSKKGRPQPSGPSNQLPYEPPTDPQWQTGPASDVNVPLSENNPPALLDVES